MRMTGVLVVWLGNVEIAFWNIEEGNWQEWPNGDFRYKKNEVTRWMPLPAVNDNT